MSAVNSFIHHKEKLTDAPHVSLSLLHRVLQLEQSINSIGSKTDAVVNKLDVPERKELKRKDLLGKPPGDVSKVGSPPPCIGTSFRPGDQLCWEKGPGIIFAFQTSLTSDKKAWAGSAFCMINPFLFKQNDTKPLVFMSPELTLVPLNTPSGSFEANLSLWQWIKFACLQLLFNCSPETLK